jgi:hypothetical protein
MEKKYFRTSYTPTTYKEFRENQIQKTGVPLRFKTLVKNISPGDIMLIYVIKYSRFCGLFEVASEFTPSSNSLYRKDDEKHFVLQADIKNIIALPEEQGKSMFMDDIWENLTLTKGKSKRGGYFQGSISTLKREDGQLLEKLIREQSVNKIVYPFSEKEIEHIKWWNKYEQVRMHGDPEKQEEVESPPPDSTEQKCDEEDVKKEYFESSKVQAQIAKIGVALGFKIWVPANDKSKIKEISNLPDDAFAESIPGTGDMRQIVKYIDVLWIDKKMIVRAFEVEGTTAIYSGLLRMADLLADNPYLNILLHIVAPEDRQEKVFSELSRSSMRSLKLPEKCSYISYDSINELYEDKNLSFYKDSIIDQHCNFIELID